MADRSSDEARAATKADLEAALRDHLDALGWSDVEFVSFGSPPAQFDPEIVLRDPAAPRVRAMFLVQFNGRRPPA